MMDWRFDQRSELHEHEHKPCHSSSSSIDAKVRSQSRLAGAYLTLLPTRLRHIVVKISRAACCSLRSRRVARGSCC